LDERRLPGSDQLMPINDGSMMYITGRRGQVSVDAKGLRRIIVPISLTEFRVAAPIGRPLPENSAGDTRHSPPSAPVLLTCLISATERAGNH
jgi:hypothetical protein